MNSLYSHAALRKAFIVGFVCAISAMAQAQYVPNFDTFSGNFSLSGQDNWVTNDSNQANYVGEVLGYSTSPTNYWAALGGNTNGNAPSTTNVALYRNFGALNTATFSAVFGVSNSGNTTADGFSWKFRTGANADIVSIDFEPVIGGLKLYYTNNGVQNAANLIPNSGIGYDAKYTITASVQNLGTAPFLQVSLTDGDNNTSTPISVSLNPSTPSGLTQVAAAWNLKGGSTANYGDNTLYFTSYSVVIPEPGTIVLLGLGGLAGWAVASRRKKHS